MVCGCGPSLAGFAPSAGQLTIGVNDVGRLFDPDYLVVVNPRSQFKPERWRAIETSGARALFTQLDLGPVRPPVVRFRLGRFGGTDEPASTALPALHYTQNSPYVAVCLAAWMGATPIGLLGVDFTDDHFFGPTGRHALAGRLREIDTQYGALALALQRRGVELVNLSPISRLAALPRARLLAGGNWQAVAHSAGPAPQTTAGSAAAAPLQLPPRTALDRAPGRPPSLPAPRVPRAPSVPPAPLVPPMSHAPPVPYTRPPATCAAPSVPCLPPRSPAMHVSIEQRSPGLVAQLLDTLAATVAGLGHRVTRAPHRAVSAPGTLAIVWNGRAHAARGPVLYGEHGWLPRSDYQISPLGINAGSHAARFVWQGVALDAPQAAALQAHLQAVRAASYSGYYRYMQPGLDALPGLPDGFLLVPLQIESDTNIVRHAPAHLRRMQALVDHIAQVNPPWPVIYKQHPADSRHGHRHLALRPRRAQDQVWPHDRGNVHQMLKSGHCRGVVTVNSNVAHDALLWDVPVVVLGRGVWPLRGPAAGPVAGGVDSAGGGDAARKDASETTPFLTRIPADWAALAHSVQSASGRACREAYAHHLVQHQWRLQDAADPARVAALLDSAWQAYRGRAGAAQASAGAAQASAGAGYPAGAWAAAAAAVEAAPAAGAAGAAGTAGTAGTAGAAAGAAARTRRNPQQPAARLAVPRTPAPHAPHTAAHTAPLRRDPPPLRAANPAPRSPVINVVAENRGWLFEAWKQQLAFTALPGAHVVASTRPLQQADAWIYIRAREAVGSPDLARSVVQLHDLHDDGRYAPGGERTCALRCGALSLTHLQQLPLLTAHGFDADRQRWILQPPGWWDDHTPAPAAPTGSGAPAAPAPASARLLDPARLPSVAWAGRAARRATADSSGLADFVQAASALRGRLQVLLAGERLEAAAAALLRAGVRCRLVGPLQAPLTKAAHWLQGVDLLVLGHGADTGPWPLFDALHAGVPVLAPRLGWAQALLSGPDGVGGALLDNAQALAPALQDLLSGQAACARQADPTVWQQRCAARRALVAGYSGAAWARANLALAASLVRGAQPAATPLALPPASEPPPPVGAQAPWLVEAAA